MAGSASGRADAALAGQTASPDASLTQDSVDEQGGLIATSERGLIYPWGATAPAAGETIRIADSLSWARIPMPGSLGHINSWLLDDARDVGSADDVADVGSADDARDVGSADDAAHVGSADDADEGGDGVAIVDTGLMLTACSDAWKALFAGALADTRITRILCTHLHPDHIGLAGWLAKRFDAPLYMTRGEWLTARFMIADVRDEPPAEVSAMQRGAGWDDEAIEAARAAGWSRMGRMVFRLPYGYRRLTDGQTLDFGPHRWRVVVGSGHSPEHACLLNEKDGVLVSGDQVLPRISSNVSMSSSEPDSDPLGEWLASIDKLLTLPGDLLVCPAHGEPFKGLHVRLEALRDEHRARLDAVAEALAEPRRAVDCFGLLFRRQIGPDHIGLATGETLAHLRHLEVEGRIHRETRDGVWWWRAT